ncbi:uncharacterized protein LOC115701218 [Cannabis sativa]|uniref:uncharacterized protein LOC115701218 n=1 Tax=Cannabis sativa TaxID=3483 RepID=UPI0011DFA6FE|nr:uncharacterized protein LOC115701218 [Cannabis sativa]
MASTIHKLLTKSPTLKILTAFNPKPLPLPLPNLNVPLTQLNYNQVKLYPYLGSNPDQSPFLGAQKNDYLPTFSHVYPSFPFGYSLNPLPLSGSIPLEAEDDSTELWADSVKKKRKRKMNKHKYNKLRKRLRRQT